MPSILITNDDGVDAPGIEVLHRIVENRFGDAFDVVVVAPDRGRSECGHGVTNSRGLRVDQVRTGWFAVDGLPVDCVRVGLNAIADDVAMTFSGINAGANLGVDLMVSGTMAAARESAIRGIPSMAVSHYRHPDVPKSWDHCDQWIEPILNEFARAAASQFGTRIIPPDDEPVQTEAGILWNVNFPAIDPTGPAPTLIRCPVDRLPMRSRATVIDGVYRSETDFHGRPRAAGTDVDCCFSGNMTLSVVSPAIETVNR